MLYITPVDIAGKMAATRAAFKLSGTDCITNLQFGHSYIPEDFEFIPDNTDHCVPYLGTSLLFSTHITFEFEWTGCGGWKEAPVNFYTDASKLGGKII